MDGPQKPVHNAEVRARRAGSRKGRNSAASVQFQPPYNHQDHRHLIKMAVDRTLRHCSTTSFLQKLTTVPSAGLEPCLSSSEDRAKPYQDNALRNSGKITQKQNHNQSTTDQTVTLQKKCVPSVHKNKVPLPQDLETVVRAWSTLPSSLKTAILAIIESNIHRKQR